MSVDRFGKGNNLCISTNFTRLKSKILKADFVDIKPDNLTSKCA